MREYTDTIKEIALGKCDINTMRSSVVAAFVLEEDELDDLLITNSKELATHIRQYAEGDIGAGYRLAQHIVDRIIEQASIELQKQLQEQWEDADGYGDENEHVRFDNRQRAADMNTSLRGGI